MARSTNTKSFSSFSIESLLRDDSGRKRSCGSSSACSQSAGFSDLLHLHTARTELVVSPPSLSVCDLTPVFSLSPVPIHNLSPSSSSIETYSDDSSDPSFNSSNSDATEDDDLEPSAKRHKKSRTSFSSNQINSLEGAYKTRCYIPAGERKQLARRLHLSDQQVKTWFQNRRMKEKRRRPETHFASPINTPVNHLNLVMSYPPHFTPVPRDQSLSSSMTSSPPSAFSPPRVDSDFRAHFPIFHQTPPVSGFSVPVSPPFQLLNYHPRNNRSSCAPHFPSKYIPHSIHSL